MTTRHAFLCEYSGHQGDRFIRDRYDRFIASIDIMTGDNKEREARLHPFGGKGTLRLCAGCKDVLVTRAHGGEPPLQGTLLDG